MVTSIVEDAMFRQLVIAAALLSATIDELTKLYGIPREATLGGAATMYPEFRQKIRDKFVRPEKCTQNCAAPAPPQPTR